MDALDEIATATDGKSAEDKIHDLNTAAIDTLQTVLAGADSDDVRRKAAVDILNFSSVGKSKGRAPVVTEAQLEFLGRVIVEASEVRKSVEGCKGPVASIA